MLKFYHIPGWLARGISRHNRPVLRIAYWEVIILSIVNTDVPMTSALCQQTIEELARYYPGIRTEVLTATAFGRPVSTLVFGQGPRRVLFSAAHHANEWITTPVILKFMEDFAQAVEADGPLAGVPARELAEAVTVFTVPMVDPDGVDLVTGAISTDTFQYEAARTIAAGFPAVPFPDGWKANLLGTDLNLNYPAGWLQAREIKFSQGYTRPAPRDYVGRAPLNQLETGALAGYTEVVDPDLVLAYHTQGKVIYWQFQDYQVPGARELGERMAAVSGYTLEDTPFESSFAGYKDWFIKVFRRPGYTVEVGAGENPLPLSQFDEIYRDNLPLLVTAALG